MTDTMLERAAKAARERYADHMGDRDIVTWEKAKSREAWLICARAALEAIREPSEAMVRDCRWGDQDVAEWVEGVDAILSEGSTNG